MTIHDSQYTPVLKWRTAEYQSLYRLSEEEKNQVVPLIVLPPVEFDFETRKPNKTLDEHVDSFIDRFGKKWNSRPALVDLHPSLFNEPVSTGEDAMTYIFRSIGETANNAVPVIGQSDRAIAPALQSAKRHRCGLGVRLFPEQILDGTLAKIRARLTGAIDLSEIDLIIDLQKPVNFEPLEDFASALSMHIAEIDDLMEYRSFVVIGTSA